MPVQKSEFVKFQKKRIDFPSILRYFLSDKPCLRTTIKACSSRIYDERTYISACPIQQIQADNGIFSAPYRHNISVFQIEITSLHHLISLTFEFHETVYIRGNTIHKEEFPQTIKINLSPELQFFFSQAPTLDNNPRRTESFPITDKFYHADIEKQQFDLLIREMVERIKILMLESMLWHEHIFAT